MTRLSTRNLGLVAGTLTAFGLTAAAVFASAAGAAKPAPVAIGAAAPAFTAVDTKGVSHTFPADFADKTVVLEWTNNECPYVKKHYGSGNMQGLQKAAAEDGVVWLQIISSAPGKQGHVDAATADALNDERNAAPTATILDASGSIGSLYGAKTTPHMFVVDQGVVAYAGAIDSKRSSNAADIAGATNYVTAALSAIEAGQPVDPAITAPYGCGVKY